MTKKDFIALADAVRAFRSRQASADSTALINTSGSAAIGTLVGCELADFCQSRNPRFNRDRWLKYIAGECGPNGGKP
jgi:hypothetical protein